MSYPAARLPGPVSPCCGAPMFDKFIVSALCVACLIPVDLRRLEWRLMAHFALIDEVA